MLEKLSNCSSRQAVLRRPNGCNPLLRNHLGRCGYGSGRDFKPVLLPVFQTFHHSSLSAKLMPASCPGAKFAASTGRPQAAGDMHKSILIFTAAALCLPLAGCGGCFGPSASDMRKYAQRRSAPEVEAPKTPAPDAKGKSPGAAAAKAAGGSPAPSLPAAASGATVPAEVKPEGPESGSEPPPRPVTET